MVDLFYLPFDLVLAETHITSTSCKLTLHTMHRTCVEHPYRKQYIQTVGSNCRFFIGPYLDLYVGRIKQSQSTVT